MQGRLSHILQSFYELMHEDKGSRCVNEVEIGASDNFTMPSPCKDCGCQCNGCGNVPTSYLDLHQKIAELHSQLERSNAHSANLELELLGSRQNTDLEVLKVKDELVRLRERYERLLDSHKKMQKLNHDLEDKLLRMVTQSESEKVSLQHEISTMMNKLVEARILITQLDEENDKYRADCNMAVQLLQCKPSTFVAHKLNTLPLDLQERVKQHMTRDQIAAAENHSDHSEEQKLIRVPMATFPPTAMVYSLNQNAGKQDQQGSTENSQSSVPMSLIARVLSQKHPRPSIPRMYMCTSCKKDIHNLDKGSQVDMLPSRPARTVEVHPRSSHSEGGQSFIHSISTSPRSSYFQSNFAAHQHQKPAREHRISTSSTETDF